MKLVAKITLLALAVILILTMLQAGPRQQTEPSAIVFLQTETSAISASETPIPILPAETITAAPAIPPIFRDDFNGTLAPDWEWTNQDASAWSLAAFPGYLQLSLADGTVRDGSARNLLLYPMPEGDIQVTAMFTFRPTENFQFAGLVFYESNANHFQVGRSYCRGYGEPCINSGIYIQYFKDYRIAAPNEASVYGAISPLILRVTKRSNEYALDVSSNGEVWIRFAKYTLDFHPTRVGLIAAQNQGEPATALFDFFEISAAPK